MSNPKTPLLAEQAITSLKGVGASFAQTLFKLGIETVQDLLLHVPRQYEDRSRISAMASLRPGMTCLVEGEILSAENVFGRRKSFMVRISDGSGYVVLRFYHVYASQQSQFPKGKWIRVYGEVRTGSTGLEIYHPEYEMADVELPPPSDVLTPIYGLTEGLTQIRLRPLMQQALLRLNDDTLPDFLPAQHNRGWSLAQALRYLHQPPTDANQTQLRAGQHPAQARLAFEELLAHQLTLQKHRQELRADRAMPLPIENDIAREFLAQLPYQLTAAQLKVTQEINRDLAQAQPMLRLVQGDVGAGKTVVAALAACAALAAGCQVALMAPTEILAEQHALNFSRWFEPLGITVYLLLGRDGVKKRRENFSALKEGSARLIIGTHALFQDDVEFAQLALVIIDEQHRFGVHQRLALKQKGYISGFSPHQLIMTATPIPRTLAMSAYGDLDTSVIDGLPPGRTPIKTVVLANDKRNEVVERIRALCSSGRQVYWVCTLIEESDLLQAQAAEVVYAELQEALPEWRLGLVHGRLKASEKSRIMDAFKAHELDILVATTVIEVGVDVPNACLMVIENSERLGLAQLHQLRGRVGRGAEQSFCVLLYQAPLSYLGKQRLNTLRESSDGFVIAEKDLELRGPGEVLGTRQTGLLQFRLADLERDAYLLESAHELASALLQNDALAAEQISKRWTQQRAQFADV